jgi:flagellar operon protein
VSDSPFFYPNVSSIPGASRLGEAGGNERVEKRKEGVPSEFDEVLNQVKPGLRFSNHASQRLRERQIQLDPLTLSKVNQAVDQAEAKGVEDTLVLTPNAALIVNVKNRTVVTAVDRNTVSGNVFTNIDGAVVI